MHSARNPAFNFQGYSHPGSAAWIHASGTLHVCLPGFALDAWDTKMF
jgi:hypothetical protein